MTHKKKMLMGYEGKSFPDGRIIYPGALNLRNDRVPVLLVYDQNPIGWAYDLAREEENLFITVEIMLDLPQMDLDDWRAEMGVFDLKQRHSTILSGLIYYIKLVPDYSSSTLGVGKMIP